MKRAPARAALGGASSAALAGSIHGPSAPGRFAPRDEAASRCRSHFRSTVEAPDEVQKENDMTKFMLATASALALAAAPAQAQLLGNIGGTVNGALNGTVGATLNGTGSLGSSLNSVG